MKVIVAGGRYFNDYDFVKQKLDYFLPKNDVIVDIVSGRCNIGTHTFTTEDNIKVYGADGLGEKYAKEKSMNVKPFPAKWSKHGNAAGPIRNEEMAKYATHCICFWDGRSAGTKNMIDLAKKSNLVLRIIMI